MVITKTFPLKTITNANNNNLGFTLIEVMIVLGIITALLAVGVPRIRRDNTNIKSVTREMSVLTREIRNQSRLKNITHRLVFNVGPDSPKYWVEAAAGKVLVKELQKTDLEIEEKEKEKSEFTRSEKFSKKDKVLPPGFYFALVEKSSREEGVTNGEASIYFSPEGLVEKSLVQVTNDKITWTLVINPLTGHTEVVEKALTLKDIVVQ